MIVIAILGIVAALAIPAYTDYIIRAKVANMITAAGVIKQAVSEYRGLHGNFNGIDPTSAQATFTALGIDDPAELSETVSEIKFATADASHVAVIICGKNETLGINEGDSVDIFLTGEYLSSGMVWTCGYTGNSKYVPSSCRVLYDPDIYGEADGTCTN